MMMMMMNCLMALRRRGRAAIRPVGPPREARGRGPLINLCAEREENFFEFTLGAKLGVGGQAGFNRIRQDSTGFSRIRFSRVLQNSAVSASAFPQWRLRRVRRVDQERDASHASWRSREKR